MLMKVTPVGGGAMAAGDDAGGGGGGGGVLHASPGQLDHSLSEALHDMLPCCCLACITAAAALKVPLLLDGRPAPCPPTLRSSSRVSSDRLVTRTLFSSRRLVMLSPTSPGARLRRLGGM